MAAFTGTELGALQNSVVREVVTKLALFDGPADDFTSTITVDTNIATTRKPCVLISPTAAIVTPGESVVLYSSDSYDLTPTVPLTVAQTAWSLTSGSAILAPAGTSCTVTPTGGENSVVVVRCTGTNSLAQTNYREVPILCSTKGWEVPTGTITLSGSYGARGWSGSMEISGDSAAGLAKNKLLLVHIDCYYDGVKVAMGGYRRAENLALLKVDDWTTEPGSDGRNVTQIKLSSPANLLQGYMHYSANDVQVENPLLFASTNLAAHTVYYHASFKALMASYMIATQTPLSKRFNVTLFDDSRTITRLDVAVGPLFTQVASPAESVLCMGFCDFAGSLLFVPHPAIRADEWWGTPSPRWTSINPLTRAYIAGKPTISYYPEYHESGVAWAGVTLSGYDENANPVEARAGTHSGKQNLVDRSWSGYILTGDPLEETWAEDILSLKNRIWDLKVPFFGIGNALNVGDFVYVNIDPEQTGQPAVTGNAYIHSINHRIDIGRRMMWSEAEMSQLTGQIA